MARISDSAARCWRTRSRSVAALLSLACVAFARQGSAGEVVSVLSSGAELEPLLSRLESELTTGGYTVRVELATMQPACTSGSNEAWVSIAVDPENSEFALATVCSRGATATTRGPRADPARFAVTAAEALNGLHAAPIASAPRPSEPQNAAAIAPLAPTHDLAVRRGRVAFSLAETLVLDPRGFPALWGTSLDAEWTFASRFALLLGGFVPISRAELSSAEADLHAGVAFARAGVSYREELGEFGLSGSLTAGPAWIWVSADANAPRVGGRASTVSALGSVGAELTYPARGRVFALARCRATLLLPAGRFILPNEPSRTLGPALIEVSLGIGARF